MRFSRAKPTGSFRVFQPGSRRVAVHTETLAEARKDAAYWVKATGSPIEIQERFPSGKWVTRESHARVVHQEPTGRAVFAAHERDHHITTSGRRALERGQFALPPGPEEKRRGIKGRLPIDTIKRGRNALARAAQEHKRGDITAAQLGEVQRAVHRAWPSIGAGHHAHAHATTRHCYVITMPPTAEVGSYKTKHCGSKAEAREHALWDYNKAREHDGLPPVQRLPAGTKVARDLTRVV